MTMLKISKQRIKTIAVSALCIGAITGCSRTEPFSDADRSARSQADLQSMFENQTPIVGTLSLGEAIARAIKYNLDHRLKMMEMAVSERQYQFDRASILPDLVADAGYFSRNNSPGADSLGLDGTQVGGQDRPTTSRERSQERANLVLSWDTLDFGLSYYSARQSSDEVYIAQERRRKTVQNITQDVIDAFWSAWMAQTLSPQVNALMAETEAAISQSADLVRRGVQNSQDSLSTQRDLMQTRSALLDIRERIALAHTRLNALLNLPQGSEYEVAAPLSMDVPGPLALDTDALVQYALINRPELIEEDYSKRIAQVDVKKAVVEMFPNLNLSTGYHYDGDRFLVNNDWSDVSAVVSWNLFDLFNVHQKRLFRKAQVAQADARRQALSMAVMTQVYLSVSRYELARSRYDGVAQLADVNDQFYRSTTTRGSRSSAVNSLQAKSTALASEMRKAMMFAELQAAYARVLNSAGIDPLPSQVESHEISDMSNAFDQRWSNLVKGVLSN